MRTAAKRVSQRAEDFSNWVQGVPSKVWVITATGPGSREVTYEREVPTISTLPRFVLVVSDQKFLKARSLTKKLFEKHSAVQQIEVYSCSAAATPAFRKRFGAAEPLVDGFVVGVLYCFLQCTGRFVPVTSYMADYTMEKVEELLYVVSAGGAKVVIIDENLYKEVSSGTRRDLKFTVPEGVPVGAESGALAQERQRRESHRAGTMVDAEFAGPPEYLPYYDHGAARQWFYQNRQLPKTVQTYIGAVEAGNARRADMTVHLIEAREVEHVDVLQAEVAQVIGVGFAHDMRTRAEFDKSLTIKFFTDEDFEGAKCWGGRRSTVHGMARRSLSQLATLRAEFIHLRSIYREDILMVTKTGAAISEQDMQDMVANDLKDDRSKPGGVVDAEQPGFSARANEWFFGSQMETPGKTLTVPFYLYGPAGAGRTSVLFTWEQALGEADKYYNEGAAKWHRMSSGAACGSFETFKAVRFDPTPETRRNRHGVAALNDEQFSNYSLKNQARVIVHDTRAATGFATTADSRKFPFGIALLVLDYTVVAVAAAASEGTREEEDQEDDDDDDDQGGAEDARKHSKAMKVDAFEQFLGDEPLRNVSGDAKSRGGRLRRYPPMVVILAKCPENVSREQRQGVETWFAEKYAVTWVHAMVTFKPPTEEERSAFLGVETSTRQVSRWTATAVDALVVFDSVIMHTLEHEQDVVMVRLDKLESKTPEPEPDTPEPGKSSGKGSKSKK